jgi:copper oxidase (laccase) domain-containing protein
MKLIRRSFSQNGNPTPCLWTKGNIAQVENEGIKEEQIFWIDLCTSCHKDLFFSNRKEGKTGRQLSFIGIME